MATLPDPTRRDFLLKLAKAAAFVPPVMATLSVRPLAGQGGGSSVSSTGTKGGGVAAGQTTIGSISPTAQQIDNSRFNIDQGPSTSPWNAQQPGEPPPWSRPPPTQTGR